MKKILRFTATWCQPCKMLAIYLEDAEIDLPIDVIDIDENQQLAAENYGAYKAAAWQTFYRYSPTRCRELVVAALRQLTGV